MGLGIGVSGGRSARQYYPSGPFIGPVSPPPNPDPENFKIIMHLELGPYTVLLLQYPGCTNYEGKKVVVYKAPYAELKRQPELDPHFLERGLSPIARFRPTAEGWADAIRFAGSCLDNE